MKGKEERNYLINYEKDPSCKLNILSNSRSLQSNQNESSLKLHNYHRYFERDV